MIKQLMIGASDGSQQLIDEARKRGVYTIVAGQENAKRSLDSVGADEKWVLDTSDIDNLETRCRENGINAIINGISTYNIAVCMELGKRLGLPCYATPGSWHYTVDKYDFKKLCRETGVPVAKDYFVSNPATKEELDLIEYPVVVKAVDLSSNRGMSYCYKPEEIQPACDFARSLSDSSNVVIEKMLKGTEYSSFYAVADGEASLISFVCMLSQTGHPGNCYSVTTTETDQLDNYIKEVHPNILSFIDKAGIKEGICWFEMMLDTDGHLYVLEMGYRMSGDLLAIPMKEAGIFDSYKWLTDISLGIKHTENDLPDSITDLPEKLATSYIIWSNEKCGIVSRLDGLDEIRKLNGVYVDNTLTIGTEVVPHQYLVIVLIVSESRDELIDTIKAVNDNIAIENEKGEDIVIRFTDFDKIIVKE